MLLLLAMTHQETIIMVFQGDGREILFRRGIQFVTPNAADDSMYLYNLVMLDGKVWNWKM